MMIVRRCPRCGERLYHFVASMSPGGAFDHDKPLPAKVRIDCAACGHPWKGRLNRAERGIDK